MCTVCGCSGTAPAKAGDQSGHGHDHGHGDDHNHGHGNDHAHGHDHGHDHHHGHDHTSAGDAGEAVRVPGGVHPGVSAARILQVEADILGENNRFAAANRRRLAAAGTAAINLMSGPGAGKTTLLVQTVQALAGRLAVAVIEGDQQTAFDAERVRAAGAPAIQINTGKGCHLDAHMVGHALADLALPAGGVVFIENVGNLVCPAAFDLGESARVVLLSVTEGDDKPLKYPDMFATADLLVITKADLKPYVPFDVGRAIDFARRVRAGVPVLEVSALSGEGMADWLGWIERRVPAAAATTSTAGVPA